MDYKIEKKEAFTVIASAKTFPYEGAKELVPLFWQEHFKNGGAKTVMGMFGINIDEEMGGNTFEYLIADLCEPEREVPNGYVKRTVPSFTWAVFPCRGPMPVALQDINTKIYTEWLPALKDYEFAAGYCVEMYSDPEKYKALTYEDVVMLHQEVAPLIQPYDVDPTQRNSLNSHSHHNNHLNQACRQTCSKHRASE